MEKKNLTILNGNIFLLLIVTVSWKSDQDICLFGLFGLLSYISHFSFQVNYDGLDIPLPFNFEILQWACETRKILSCAEVPSQVKFYNIYGMNLETPHSVW